MAKLNLDLSQSIKSDNGEYYKIIQPLGEGKSATAYLGLKTSSTDGGTFYVIKLMQHPADSLKLANFNNEKSQLKNLTHSSIMNVSDEGSYTLKSTGKNYPFYVCNFYSKNLSAYIGNDAIKLTQKLSYAIQMCSALAYLATKNIIHCDIKPDNIYVDGLKCVLADFGLARNAGGSATSSDLPSLHKYRSPDIVTAIKNNAALTAKSDVFQLGLVLTELFTGTNPCLETPKGDSKVFIDDLKAVHGKFGDRISKLLQEMLEQDASKRPDATSLIGKWQTVLFDAYDYILEIDKNVF